MFKAKLRRMVEEHSSSLVSRIESDYPNSIPVPISNSACNAQELKISDAAASEATPPSSSLPVAQNDLVKNAIGGDSGKETKKEQDDTKLRNGDIRKEEFKTNKPSSIESRRSKSLNNTSSLDSNEEVSKVSL